MATVAVQIGQDVVYVTAQRKERAAKIVKLYVFPQVTDIPNPGPEGHLVVRITDGVLVKPYAVLAGSEDAYREMDLADHQAFVVARNAQYLADLLVFGVPEDGQLAYHVQQVKQGVKPGLANTYYVPGQPSPDPVQAATVAAAAPIDAASAG